MDPGATRWKIAMGLGIFEPRGLMAVLILGLWWLQRALLVTMIVGLLVRGPRRWVRICTAIFVVVVVALRSLTEGPAEAAKALALTAGFVFVLNFLALRTWRAPRRVHYAGTAGQAWPEHAAGDIDGWTRELLALGLTAAPDVWYAWRVGGKSRSTALRVFSHPTEPLWVTLSAAASPKSVGRTINSRLADGRWLQTTDRLSDAGMFPDPAFETQRVPSVSFARMLDAHRAKLATFAAKATPVIDPVDEHRTARDAWIDALLARGKMRSDGENVALSSLAVVQSVPRMFAAWLA